MQSHLDWADSRLRIVLQFGSVSQGNGSALWIPLSIPELEVSTQQNGEIERAKTAFQFQGYISMHGESLTKWLDRASHHEGTQAGQDSLSPMMMTESCEMYNAGPRPRDAERFALPKATGPPISASATDPTVVAFFFFLVCSRRSPSLGPNMKRKPAQRLQHPCS